MLDLIVVGTGVMGAAAARHAAVSGASVLAIGEPEPVSPESHHGLFGAWHDISRLSWRLHSNPADTELALRSLRAISALEAGGASQILTETGFLNLAAPHLDEGLKAASLSDQPVSTTSLDRAELRTQFPFLSVPRNVTAYTEGPPSGHINVRRLVESQQAAAVAAGAELLAGTVVGVAASSGGVTVAMLDGRVHKASRVLLATGAFSNTTAFLPRPLAFRLKTETVLLAELDPNEAKTLTGMPAIHYQIDSPVLSSIYMVPPLAHPSGKILMKFGANTRFDTHLSTADEIGAWYRNGPSDQAVADLRSEFEPMFPALEVAGWHTSRCVITFTPHGHPFIDTVVPGRLYVATGGNGHSAKWSDGLGGLAASLALNNEWTDPIDPGMFSAQFADEDYAWAGRPLVADRLT